MSRVPHHLDNVLVGGQGAGQVANLHQLGGVLREHSSTLVHHLLVSVEGSLHQHREECGALNEAVTYMIHHRLSQLAAA